MASRVGLSLVRFPLSAPTTTLFAMSMPTPPPCIRLRAGVGSFELTTTAVQTMSHVGSSLLPLPWVTHNDDGKPRRLVVGSFASVCTHDDDDKPRRLVVASSASVRTHNDDDKPTWLVVVAPVFSCTPSLANASGGCYINILIN